MIAEHTILDRIEEFPARCREAGLKVTSQRMVIYAMLMGTASHPTPDEVFLAVRLPNPSISLATVYKILDLFQERGFIRRVSTQNQVTRYDANLLPHHHLICDRCGSIQDIKLEDLSVDALRPPESAHFRMNHCEVQFQGICSTCL